MKKIISEKRSKKGITVLSILVAGLLLIVAYQYHDSLPVRSSGDRIPDQYGAKSETAECGDASSQGRFFQDINDILVHVELPLSPHDNWQFPEDLTGDNLRHVATTVLRNNFSDCISGQVRSIDRGYDDAIANVHNLTALISYEFEGESALADYHGKDPEFIVISAGYYRPIDPEAQFLNRRLVKTKKIPLLNQSSRIADQIRDFISEVLKPRKQALHPGGALTRRLHEARQKDSTEKGQK